MGAKQVRINTYHLKSKEYQQVKIPQNVNEIKYRIFSEGIKSIKTSLPQLGDDRAIDLSIQLLDFLKPEKRPNERYSEYDRRILNDVMKLIELEEVMKGI